VSLKALRTGVLTEVEKEVKLREKQWLFPGYEKRWETPVNPLGREAEVRVNVVNVLHRERFLGE